MQSESSSGERGSGQSSLRDLDKAVFVSCDPQVSLSVFSSRTTTVQGAGSARLPTKSQSMSKISLKYSCNVAQRSQGRLSGSTWCHVRSACRPSPNTFIESTRQQLSSEIDIDRTPPCRNACHSFIHRDLCPALSKAKCF